eukprot:3508297-Alexandrium_andersonii.AAC.1
MSSLREGSPRLGRAVGPGTAGWRLASGCLGSGRADWATTSCSRRAGLLPRTAEHPRHLLR